MKHKVWSRKQEARSRIIMHHASCLLLLASCFLLLSACATSFDARGRFHRVQSGENIWKIAGSYRVPVQDLAEINNIQEPPKLERGQKLYIPPRPRGRAWKKLSFDAPIEVDRSRFIWPVDGKIFSGFGIRNGRRHDGIDIAAKAGTPIRAASDGKVVFSNKLSGYGNTIIIKHADGFFTIYAHNQRNVAEKGKKVKKGELVAHVGSTGRATGPHCHFEIRHRQKARNPLFFLPVKN